MRGRGASEGAGSGSPAPLPARLAEFTSWLGALETGAMTDRERVDAMAALQSAAAAIAGAQAELTAAYADSQRALGASSRGAATEVGLARRVGLSRAMDLVRRSRTLVDDLPCLLGLLRSGDLDEHRALLVADRVSELDPVTREQVDAALADDVGRLSDRELRDAVDRAVAELDPEAVERRRADALARRHVSVRPAPDGMADLAIRCSAVDAAAAMNALGSHADAVLAGVGGLGAIPETDDGRGRDAIMADAALAWLSGRDGYEGPAVEVQLVMSESALFAGPDGRLSAAPAQVVGVGPLPAASARRLVGLGARETELDRGSVGAGSRVGESRARARRAEREARRVTIRRVWASGDGGRLTGVESRRRVMPTAVRRSLRAEVGAVRRRGFPGDRDRSGRGLRRAGPDPRLVGFHDELRRPPRRSDLVELQSTARCFTGGLRRFVELRDQVCRVPFCGARIRHLDHIEPYRFVPETTAAGGMGLCAGHNLAKEDEGHAVTAVSDGFGATPHEVAWCTPTGRVARAVAPPVLGWGTAPTDHSAERDEAATSPLESALEHLLGAA